MTTRNSMGGSIASVELTSQNPTATQEFFEAAFDWEFQFDVDLGHTVWRGPQPLAGGLMTAEGDTDEYPTTLLYVATEHLEETRRLAIEAGGEVLETEFEVPGLGVFSIFEDPAGVVTAAWEDRSGDGLPMSAAREASGRSTPGSITHVELCSDDPAGTADFVEAVYGWAVEGRADEYTIANLPAGPTAGIVPATAGRPVGTLLYLSVPEVEKACMTCALAGGGILREPVEIAGWGTTAVLRAPGNVPFAVWEPLPEPEGASDDREAGRAEP